MDKLIEVRNLNFGYSDKLILRDISLYVNRGDFLGIIGANGSGKSTLLKLMLRTLTPISGHISLLGQNIKDFKRWSKIGYISQKATSFNGSFPATVEEVVQANLFSDIGLFKYPKKIHKEMVYHALERVEMHNYAKRLMGNLSGGQQQRVFLARVLVNSPELIFLDEPTSGIDARSEEAVYCLLARLNHELGLTVVMVTHDLGAIMAHSNRLICLGENGLLEHDPSHGLTRDVVTQIYGYDINLHLSGSGHCKNCTRKEGK
ncbi:zinc transport system ATP-binding protein [Anaerobacterium chartisolvens]|uniref:Zinc transport system ATP-binding protein n=1 Tax=Anaerobacterium chartisolvens TaxID=1297424 RepID=A0A369BC09_9FIRM|nr:metal ABC transporter ATP-binding protein [Anaerobacterium chartisolvens]RCX18885.1 zinc transport system ATP-binding protein [Anaerobacterium chartisolvens]